MRRQPEDASLMPGTDDDDDAMITTGACWNPDANATLPDHCCWFGVSCCLPALTCQYAPPSCSCDEGMITGLNLQGNNVGSVKLAAQRSLAETKQHA
jgi:hypothetical protein